MAGSLVRDLWFSRAVGRAREHPDARVGVRGAVVRLPCGGTGRNKVPMAVFGANVPGIGNCLYHAVWVAAEFAGVRVPFGMTASKHVFELRAKVGLEVVRLLEEQTLHCAFGHEPLHVGNLVASPNQYLEYSGVIPIAAMACMLKRVIVTLCADGVYVTTPGEPGPFLEDPLREEPVVIYHCAADRVADIVSLDERNHYVAVTFADERARRDFAAAIRRRYTVEIEPVLIDITTASEAPSKRKRAHSRPPEKSAKRSKLQNEISEIPRSESGRLEYLIAEATSISVLTNEDLELLRQNFTKHPRLALLYFHCCSTDPAACVFADEKLEGAGGEATVERLIRNLDEPMNATTAKFCQDRFHASSRSSGDLWACASCCEFLNTVEDRVRWMALDELHQGFQLSRSELDEIKEIPGWVVDKHLQIYRAQGILYHLNPDLVHDPSAIPLCCKCWGDPRTSEFSIASGHDYGRSGSLPELGEIATKCISPVRVFKVEVVVSGKHSIGHSICFPSDGPVESSKVLPCTSDENIPRVTFVGPRGDWPTRKKSYSNLFLLPADDMYSWMRVLMHTHEYFKTNRIEIDDSETAKAALAALQARMEKGVVFAESEEAEAMDDDIVAERFGEEYNDGSADVPIIATSAVLKDIDGLDLGVKNAAVDAMLSMIDKTPAGVDSRPVVTVRRGKEPITEWFQNGDMIAAAFPCLFMKGGKVLPNGTWPTPFIKHLMRYYDGRFEKNTALVATLFNQLQRHTAIKRAAQVGSTRPAVLERLGKLANSDEFREMLVKVKSDPESAQSKRVNAHLLRILSLVGGCVPFSAFERATMRPKLGALRAKYGIPLHWVTVAPPEHHDLELHRIAALRALNAWNQPDIVFQQKECRQEDLPETVRCHARGRLAISNAYPALAARAFEKCTEQILNDIVLCKAASATRISRDYNQREVGAYGTIAAFAAVVEPQADGRLHIHMTLYGSRYNPTLLSRIMCSPVLRQRAAQFLESICCTNFDASVHEWRKSCIDNGALPKAFEIPLPDASDDFGAFLKAAQMRAATTNFHSHTSTCFKGNRGKQMCRLARPAGVHEGPTSPLIVIRERKGNPRTGITPVVVGHELKPHILRAIDNGYSYEMGQCFRPHCEGPILWELSRPATDTRVVETNLLLAALTASHTNSSFVNGEDSGDLVEEYQEAYMSKGDVPLKSAASAMLSAAEHNLKYPSRAADSRSELRTGKYLATRTINSFSGSHEWSHSLMVYAITGHRSFISSDKFWYIFPFALSSFVKQLKSDGEKTTTPANSDIEQRSIEDELAALVETANDEDYSKDGSSRQCAGSGVRTFKIDGDVVFLTQAESYYHRGQHFADFSPLEFECIVDVLPAEKVRGKSSGGSGRPPRQGFPFAVTHPLFASHLGVIRAKLLTPIFGGAPPPTWSNSVDNPVDEKNRNNLARYLLCAFTPWETMGPGWSFDAAGLLAMCSSWDCSSAALINRERCRFARNLMKKGFRCSRNEQTATDWRNRGADYWKSPRSHSKQHSSGPSANPEFDGIVSPRGNLYELLSRAAAGSATRRSNIASLKSAFSALFHDNDAADGEDDFSVLPASERGPSLNPVFRFGETDKSDSLSQVASSIKTFQTGTGSSDDPTPTNGRGDGGVTDPFEDDYVIDSCDLSAEQLAAVKCVISGIDRAQKRQTLTLVHGGGGTGKSYVVRRIHEEVERRRYKVVATCPTGAGACQLTKGRTFHSALKCGKGGSRLSARSAAFLRQLFDATVELVVVDEISMFKAKHLVLLDERLRGLYDSNLPFGGKSILLTGDFWQLQVVKGISLCKCMYMQTKDPVLLRARYLFSLFTVFALEKQHRASGCRVQQALLERFRRLPVAYPQNNRWGKDDSAYRPIDSGMVASLTRPLTRQDVVNDESWVGGSVVLVTSNVDRAVLNTCMAAESARRSKTLLFRWRKPILGAIADFVQEVLYNEAEHPELFGYFYYGAPGQILDNTNGNVALGVANGTRCWYHSMGWDDDELVSRVLQLTEEALHRGESLVELPVAPEFINVRLTDRDGNLLSGSEWPDDMNLETTWVMDANGRQLHKQDVIIPVGIAQSNSENYAVRLDESGKKDNPIRYEQHGVDLALALTVWKAQGSTFDRVVALLEGSANAPTWQFEHIYVAVSRAKRLYSQVAHGLGRERAVESAA